MTYMVGELFLIAYICSNVLFSESVAWASQVYNRSYVIRYIDSAMLMVVLIIPLICKIYHKYCAGNNEYTILKADSNIKDFVKLSVISGFANNTGGIIFYIALNGYLSVPTSMSLSKLMSVWIFLLSIYFIPEQSLVTIWKGIGILISFSGVVCYGFEIKNAESQSQTIAKNQTSDTLFGAILAISGGFLFAVGFIFFAKLSFKHFKNSNLDKFIATMLFVGLGQGLLTVICFFWFIFVEQPIYFPSISPSDDQLYPEWTAIIASGLSLLAVNTTGNITLSLTSAIHMSVGGMLSVPLSFIADCLFRQYSLKDISYLSILGAVFILIGFAMLESILIIPKKYLPVWWNKFDESIYLKMHGYGPKSAKSSFSNQTDEAGQILVTQSDQYTGNQDQMNHSDMTLHSDKLDDYNQA